MVRVGDKVTHNVRNLGVQFDTEITMESYVTAVCKSAIFHLRNISRTRRLFIDILKTKCS